MFANTRYLLYLFIIIYVFLLISAYDELSVLKQRNKRHLFPLLGYLHGYKIGQNLALQLPPMVLSPVIIIPTVNQQQSINIQKSCTDEDYQDNGGTFQNISPAKLVATSNEFVSELKKNNETEKMETTIDLENMLHQKNKLLHSDTFRQAIINETDVPVIQENLDEYSTTTPYTETTDSERENLQIGNITKPPGPYANATYNNDNISQISIAAVPLEYNLTVPIEEDTWQNFNKSSNELGNDINNINTTVRNFTFNPSREYTVIAKPYPYPRSWYNSKVDRLSITTNSYTNEDAPLPPSYDDRWQRFSLLRKSYPSSGFRPLAGLYYDGFLHKSLTKEMGFTPYRTNGYYYNG